jgi:hypothetical protein
MAVFQETEAGGQTLHRRSRMAFDRALTDPLLLYEEWQVWNAIARVAVSPQNVLVCG